MTISGILAGPLVRSLHGDHFEIHLDAPAMIVLLRWRQVLGNFRLIC